MKASNNKEEKPHFVKRDKFAITAEYKQWFADIKSRLRNSQIKAAIKVNGTLLEFYWSLGRDIVKMKAEQAWGSGVLQQLSFDLRDEFPDMKGLSYTYNPQNEMFRLLGTKRSFSQNETFFFSHP